MQRVAEFVEERRGVGPADERRLARLALHEVRVVRDDGLHLAVEALLVAVRVHPRARALALARVRVEVPQAHEPALLVGDLPDLHVRVIHGDRAFLDRREGEAEQLLRHVEHAVAQVVELHVRRDLGLVEVVLVLADFFRVKAVVPRLDLDARAFLVGDGLHVRDFLVDPRRRRRPHGRHERHGAIRVLGHRVLEPPVRVRLVAEELRPLAAQCEDLRDRRVVVRRAAAVAAVHEHAPDLFTQRAVSGVREERLDARARVQHRPLALLAARLGGERHRFADRRRQAREVGLCAEQHHLLALVLEHVLSERRVERREFLVDLGEALLLVRVELRAGAHELVVVPPHEPLLLGSESGGVALGVDLLDALEERFVLRDLVEERRELRLHLALDRLHGVVVHRRAVDVVDGGGPTERAAAALELGDRVVEGRRRRVRGDLVDLREVGGHSHFERGPEHVDLDLVERRHTAERTGPGGDERRGEFPGLVVGGVGGHDCGACCKHGGEAGSLECGLDGHRIPR